LDAVENHYILVRCRLLQSSFNCCKIVDSYYRIVEFLMRQYTQIHAVCENCSCNTPYTHSILYTQTMITQEWPLTRNTKYLFGKYFQPRSLAIDNRDFFGTIRINGTISTSCSALRTWLCVLD